MVSAEAAPVDVAAAVASVRAELEANRDPAYEAGMRRTVPSAQPVHATRVPVVRDIARRWARDHRSIRLDELFAVCEALWATGWREERLVAITVLTRSRAALAAMSWERTERWSEDIDNWELVDHLARVTAAHLLADEELLSRVMALEVSSNPWQRRLALVTLIVATQRDARWLAETAAMAERLRDDPHPLVRRAVVWARATTTKAGAKRG